MSHDWYARNFQMLSVIAKLVLYAFGSVTMEAKLVFTLKL